MPLDSVYPPGVSVQDADKEGAVEMSNSQKEAIAAALTHLGEHLQSMVTVAGLSPQSPSKGKLRTNDTIRSVGGIPVDNVTALRAAIAANGAGKPLPIGITRAGRSESVTVVPQLSRDPKPVPILGIYTMVDYTLPFPVSIELENVGGPSAGQMFALGIIDKLTPGALTGGKSVAGTGTIDASGAVGKIGGIRQKLRGAQQAGAKWFLAPSGNCDEVAGHVPAGLRVFAVRNLDDSLAALKAISTGSGLGALATCEPR
jgi:PDZ domain-containing protein